MNNESTDTQQETLRLLQLLLDGKQRDTLDEDWYTPKEVAEMAGLSTAETVRCWCRHGRLGPHSYESDGRTVRIYRQTVEKLRRNRWKPLYDADPSLLPPSKR